MVLHVQDPHLLIIVSSLLLGLVAGFVMHRSDFCVAGMFRDLFMFRDGYLLRVLLLLVAASMALFELFRLLGLLAPYPFPLLGPASLTSLMGGVVFGLGMVLAGGCVVGTLYKLGAGAVVSGAALVGLLAGSALYAEFHPWWKGLAAATRISGEVVTLPQWLGVSPSGLMLPALAVMGALLYRWWRRGLLARPGFAEGWLQPWKAALILALIGLASYFFVGMPLGITTSYAKLGATVESWFAPAHVASVGYFTAVPMNYTPPFADTPISGGAGPALDGVAAIQYPLIVGILLGAFFSARRLGEFRLYWRVPARQYAAALIGGAIVGLGARMTPGCNVWHLWGGVPILALQSLLFLAGLFPGAWLGTWLFRRYVVVSK